jgi:hypothetical protein
MHPVYRSEIFDSNQRRTFVLSQMKKVKNSGKTNMFDRQGVKQIADEMNFYSLFYFLDKGSPSDYPELLDEFEKYLEEN